VEKKPLPARKSMSTFQKWTIVGPLVIVIISFLLNYKWTETLNLTLSIKNDSIPIENIKLFLVAKNSNRRDSIVTDFQGRATFDRLPKGVYNDYFRYNGKTYNFLINLFGSSDLNFTQKIYPSINTELRKSAITGTNKVLNDDTYINNNNDKNESTASTSKSIDKFPKHPIDNTSVSKTKYHNLKKATQPILHFDTVPIPIMPNSNDHLLTLSSFPDKDIPSIYEERSFVFNTTYPANIGVAIFWTKCKDCNWFVSRDSIEYTQGVIVSTLKPRYSLPTGIYWQFQAGKDYKIYLADKSRSYRTFFHLKILPGETKFIEIEKKD
jgi:hypothetical protein